MTERERLRNGSLILFASECRPIVGGDTMKNFILGLLSGGIFGFFLAIGGQMALYAEAPDETANLWKSVC